VNLVSSPEIYVNERASFTTREFPETRIPPWVIYVLGSGE